MTSPFPFQSGSVLQAQQLNDITNLPINDQTASYTLVVGDAGKRVAMNVATNNTVTVNDSVFTTGDTIFIANKTSTGGVTTTITAGAGVTINSASGLVLFQHQSGQLIALSASSFLFVATLAGGNKFGQVLQTVKTDTFTLTSTTFTDVTGLAVTITPTSASSTILIFADIKLSGTLSSVDAQARLMRDSTAIYVGDAASTRTQASSSSIGGQEFIASATNIFIDSPATTSAVTYKVQIRGNTVQLIAINRSQIDSAPATSPRLASSITVIEILP